ncbi:Mucorpepsin [Choanephora cucurbitarum]|uniref:Mucorpepsin n=1 Tax=Choanephora cucurbitarum TaxID=101091 RepID=A0A1C7N128_9FUNG|nr:Mucorpepsin [Choanephora cucurbitarum]
MMLTNSVLLVCIASITCVDLAAAAEKVLRLPLKQLDRSRGDLQKRDGSNKVPLYNANGKEYLIEVGVGTPPQYFNLTMDTGSADFWIPSSACPKSMCPHARFNSIFSSTFIPLNNQKLSIEYGVGSAEGNYGLDTLTFKYSNVSLSNTTIGVVSNTSDILVETDEMPSNGILGIGYPDLSMKSDGRPHHIVTELFDANVIAEPVFSLFLNTQSAFGKTGELILGGTDPTRYTGQIEYAPIVNFHLGGKHVSPNLGANKTNAGNDTYLYWAVPGQGASTSTGYHYDAPDLSAYVLDTGTTLTYAPKKVVQSIVMSLTNNSKSTEWDAIQEIYTVSCSLAEKSDLFVEFLISSSDTAKSTTPMKMTVPASELVIPLDDSPTPENATSCMFGIAPMPTGLKLTSGDTWVLGESVLRSLYTVFDLKQNRFGMAKLSSSSAEMTTSHSTTAAAISPSATSTLLAQTDAYSGISNNESAASLQF